MCCVVWPQKGKTPVYIAAYMNNPKCIEVLIAAKANLNIDNKVSGAGSGDGGCWNGWVCSGHVVVLVKAIGVLELMQWGCDGGIPSYPHTLIPPYNAQCTMHPYV